MVKHTQTFRQLLLTNCLSVFDHFEGLVFKGLTVVSVRILKELVNGSRYAINAWTVFESCTPTVLLLYPFQTVVKIKTRTAWYRTTCFIYRACFEQGVP